MYQHIYGSLKKSNQQCARTHIYINKADCVAYGMADAAAANTSACDLLALGVFPLLLSLSLSLSLTPPPRMVLLYRVPVRNTNAKMSSGTCRSPSLSTSLPYSNSVMSISHGASSPARMSSASSQPSSSLVRAAPAA